MSGPEFEAESIVERRSGVLGGLHAVADLLYRVSGYLVVAGLAATTILVILRVFSRVVYQIPIIWGGEAATYSMIWFIFIGFSMAFKDREIVSFGSIVGLLPPRARLAVSLLADLTVLAFLLVGLIYNQEVIRLGMRLTSPIMQIPMAYVSLALTVGFGLSTFYLLLHLVDNVMSLARAAQPSK